MKAFVLIMTACMCGCGETPRERVRIVNMQTTHEVGSHDDYTIIEFPDGHREKITYHFGDEIGEEFMAKSCKQANYAP